MVNRKEEADVYKVIKDTNISDHLIYIDSNSGYKITKYIKDAKTCDPYNNDDLVKCMKRLRDFHGLDLKVNHEFDIFKKIEFYESLLNGKPSIYCDYSKTKENVFSLKEYIYKHVDYKCLAHIDSVSDNFLIKNEDVKLIDWEYSGMQDPHVDVAMFCIYAMYDREHIDNLIDIYFENSCSNETRIKIYCYIAVCGLLWSNWCEYKHTLGEEYGKYSIRQYKYAKEYYNIVNEELNKIYV